jgi:hypothetical protein
MVGRSTATKVMNTNWNNSTAANAPADKKSRGLSLKSSSSSIWKSRISWRIALSAFLTILTVQVAILTLEIRDLEYDILSKIPRNGPHRDCPGHGRQCPAIC